MNSVAGRNVALLVARVGLGIVFLAHGLQKLNTWGYAGTKAAFEQLDVPAASISAFLATWLEILGGIALIAGVLTPVFAALLFLDMLGAFAIAHSDSGLWISDGGYEYVLVLGMGMLLLAVAGAGKFSIDGILGSRLPRILQPAPQA